jgi:hypothetical protein
MQTVTGKSETDLIPLMAHVILTSENYTPSVNGLTLKADIVGSATSGAVVVRVAR